MSGSQVRVLLIFVLVILVAFVVLNNSLPIGNASPLPSIPGDPQTARGETAVSRDRDGQYIIPEGEHLPLMIRWSNWQPEFGPAFVYARERDLAGMLQMDAPVEKMIMLTSYAEAERMMARADELKTAGVTTIGLNTENGAGMTPPNEMQTLGSADPNVNIVARVAQLVAPHGFKMMWGPVRNMTDQVSDEMIRTIMQAGVTGLALQEQKFIENQSSDARLAAVNRTRARYLRIAQELGIEDFNFDVQIMHQRCPNMANCVDFVAGLEAIPVESIAIWSNGQIPASFVRAIRGQ